jgi:hypothetical protein
MLQLYGDISAVVTAIAPRRVLATAATAKPEHPVANLDEFAARFTAEPKILLDWLKKA